MDYSLIIIFKSSKISKATATFPVFCWKAAYVKFLHAYGSIS